MPDDSETREKGSAINIMALDEQLSSDARPKARGL